MGANTAQKRSSIIEPLIPASLWRASNETFSIRILFSPVANNDFRRIIYMNSINIVSASACQQKLRWISIPVSFPEAFQFWRPSSHSLTTVEAV